jgi:hypothetical protein
MKEPPQEQMAKIAESSAKYYDSLSEEEMNEDQIRGAFSESQFPLEQAKGVPWLQRCAWGSIPFMRKYSTSCP